MVTAGRHHNFVMETTKYTNEMSVILSAYFVSFDVL